MKIHSLALVSLVMSSSILAIGCAKDAVPTAPPSVAPAGEQDLTASALPALTGNYISPKASLRVFADGRFVLRTEDEASRWYLQSSGDQKYAKCSFQRKGTLQVIQRQEQRYLSLKIAERRALKAKNVYGREFNAAEVCKTVAEMYSEGARPLQLKIATGEGRAALLTSHDQSNTVYLESASLDDGRRADSELSGALALLFTPVGTNTDVTDLTLSALGSKYTIPTSKENETVEFDREFRLARFISESCAIDETVEIKIVSLGDQILLRANVESLGGHPFAPRPDDRQKACENRRKSMNNRGGGKILDLSDTPMYVDELGNYGPFRKPS